MTVTVASFRADYTEFASTTRYPNSSVTYYLTLAGLLLNSPPGSPPLPVSDAKPFPSWCYNYNLNQTQGQRWGNLLDIGTELFIAHNLVLERRSKIEAAAGGGAGIPGVATGMVSAKSVGPGSINYDTSSVMEPGAGHWNLTTYGLRFVDLRKMVGAGPLWV